MKVIGRAFFLLVLAVTAPAEVLGNFEFQNFEGPDGCKGVQGTLESGGVTVHFDSCPTDTVARSTFWDSQFAPLTKMEFDKESEIVQYWVGGIAITSENLESYEPGFLRGSLKCACSAV